MSREVRDRGTGMRLTERNTKQVSKQVSDFSHLYRGARIIETYQNEKI